MERSNVRHAEKALFRDQGLLREISMHKMDTGFLIIGIIAFLTFVAVPVLRWWVASLVWSRSLGGG